MMLRNKPPLLHHIDRQEYITKMPWKENKRLYHLRPFSRNVSDSHRHLDAHWQQIELHPGLWISMLRCPPGRTFKCCYFKQPAMIDFGFILSGQFDHKLRKNVADRCIKANDGLSGIGYFPGGKGVVEIPAGKMLQVLHVHVAPERLHRMVQNDIGSMPMNFRSIIEGSTQKAYLSKSNMDPATQSIAFEVFNGRCCGLPRSLFLECKALELITLQLGRLMSRETRTQVNAGLSPSEKDRILAARDWLVRNLSAPPTLDKLGRRFCLSQNKLQYGFRALFGDSVFGCLREYKMQKARCLFKTAEMNVSQVAWEVGYINVSQFTKAYKKRFGILPKQYLRSILSN
jgi:AraC-like DNA-binding protein